MLFFLQKCDFRSQHVLVWSCEWFLSSSSLRRWISGLNQFDLPIKIVLYKEDLHVALAKVWFGLKASTSRIGWVLKTEKNFLFGSQALYNLIFTSLPVMAFAVFDRDLEV